MAIVCFQIGPNINEEPHAFRISFKEMRKNERTEVTRQQLLKPAPSTISSPTDLSSWKLFPSSRHFYVSPCSNHPSE